ncbi:MAG TPA: endonuclease domain-containing protein [Desulfuromonadales bacterium]|nr:endonuclease domain-containing protein [Desulfuromonadales bacterium]
MQGQTNQSIISNKLQRNLRSSMTDAEQKLWQSLRGRQMAGHKFRRQHPFDDYILDFVCLDAKLIIEVDGSQHSENADYDNERTQHLQKAGFRVLRFWNNEVLNELESVTEVIWRELQNPSPSQPPP